MSTSSVTEATFRAFRRFNDPELQRFVRLRKRIGPRALPYFSGDQLPHRLVRALANRRALPIKEVFESFEFFERVRRRIRRPHVLDLCCGHGLTGLLFAVFARKTEQITLLDHKRPANAAVVLDAVREVAPWVEGRVQYIEAPLEHAHQVISSHTSAGRQSGVVAVHACGERTDRAIAVASEHGCDMALVPCCYHGTARAASPALREALGTELATDVHRTYLLEQAGYHVRWGAIPKAVTPKNRILFATR
jgi:hypothetical protein